MSDVFFNSKVKAIVNIRRKRAFNKMRRVAGYPLVPYAKFTTGAHKER